MLRYLKYITLSRGINLFLSLLSYFASCFKIKLFFWGYPFCVSIEPTNICNYKCPECLTGNDKLSRKKGMLNLENFEKILTAIKDKFFYLQLYFQGEPFSNPDILEMIKKAKKNKFYVSISTNGSLLQKFGFDEIILSGIDEIIFSLDSLNEEDYLTYRRGGNFEIVKKNLLELINAKKKLKSKLPIIKVQFLIMRHNETKLEEYKNFVKKIGADKCEFKSIQIYNRDNFQKLLPVSKKYSRYELQNGQYIIKKKNYFPCFLLWKSAVIAWNGEVFPCCFDKNGDYSFGNIFENDYRKIFNSKRAKDFRVIVFSDQKRIDICKTCWY